MNIKTIIKWIALSLTLSGALCTSLRIDPYNIYLLNLGAVGYLSWSILACDLNLIIVNAGLLLIYIIGLFYV
jgi:hypothetical protein